MARHPRSVLYPRRSANYFAILWSPENCDEFELRELQDWVIAPRLLQVPGVADVVPFGGLIKQYQIEIDPLKLEKYNLTVAKIAERLWSEQSERRRRHDR